MRPLPASKAGIFTEKSKRWAIAYLRWPTVRLGPIDTPVHCQIYGGLSPGLTEYLNGNSLAAIAKLENVLIPQLCL